MEELVDWCCGRWHGLVTWSAVTCHVESARGGGRVCRWVHVMAIRCVVFRCVVLKNVLV